MPLIHYKNAMHAIQRQNGFTLIELIVVMTLISIMLFFAIPRFRQAVESDGGKKAARYIMMQVPLLKNKALREQKRYDLHIDLESNRIWTTNESMSEDALYEAEENAFEVSPDVRFNDVEFPKTGNINGGVAVIAFYKKGYSDKAIIHIEDEDGEIERSLLIEPFFSNVKLYENYRDF